MMSSWGTYPSRLRNASRCPYRSTPSKRTSPRSAGVTPASASSSVVLPAPLPPTIATSSRACAVKETPCSTCRPPLTVCQRSRAAISTPRASRGSSRLGTASTFVLASIGSACVDSLCPGCRWQPGAEGAGRTVGGYRRGHGGHPDRRAHELRRSHGNPALLAQLHQDEGRDEAADQAAYVGPDRDARDRERDQQVEAEPDPEPALEEAEAASPEEHECAAHQPEDRARGAGGRGIGEQQHAERAAQERHEVHEPEAEPPERRLEQRAQDPEREHVEGEVEDPDVDEPVREDAPIVARGYVRARDGPGVRERPALRSDVAAVQRAEAGDHVDADEDVRERRLVGPRLHRPHPGALVRALRAAHPDRRGGHAVRTDRAFAVRAANAGLALGVAVAGLHRGGPP